jgi:hypothetical protein
MLSKKVTIDLFTLFIWIALCYFGLSTYFMMKHTTKIITLSGNQNAFDVNSILPCKEGHKWTECPPCIQKNPNAVHEQQTCPLCICQLCEVAPPVVKEVVKVETAWTCNEYHRQYLRYGTQEQKCPFFPGSYDQWPSMPPICDYLNLECLATNVLLGVAPKAGSDTDIVQRSWSDTIFLEHVFAAFPHLGNITEVGVRSGVSSIYLSTIAKLRDGSLVSFDKGDWRLENVKKAWSSTDLFVLEDVLSSVPNAKMVEAITRENTIIIFDGDDRKQEILSYLPYMKSGTVFLGHDFGDTILTSWIDQDLKMNNAQEIFRELAVHLATFFRAFRKV